MRRKKYIPDLSKQMASCEANYLRLLKLMPDMDDCDQRTFHIQWHEHQARVDLTVEERFTYTTTIRIDQQYENQEWIEMPILLVRLYHDARMAEVVCSEHRRQFHGRYEYPNKKMRYPDEKAQLNQYLAEWLTQCLSHGLSEQVPAYA